MLLKANCENVYMTQNSRVCLLTGNILYVRPNIYIFENKKIVRYLQRYRPNQQVVIADILCVSLFRKEDELKNTGMMEF